ncbi:hypothetical protein CSKR_203298 [Clonorchis sinensis]|uniref:Uncharacterized protein n=1 Tax=Clonorchis sinensis TaxID=79923 RepID=A0A8T1MA20_CLOSI|nr:hypothetical protein CSKR_203298 [Clonorchis sinensis]
MNKEAGSGGIDQNVNSAWAQRRDATEQRSYNSCCMRPCCATIVQPLTVVLERGRVWIVWLRKEIGVKIKQAHGE